MPWNEHVGVGIVVISSIISHRNIYNITNDLMSSGICEFHLTTYQWRNAEARSMSHAHNKKCFKFCTSLIFAPVYTLECTSKEPEKWENDRANKELNPYIHPTKCVTMLPLAIEHECEPCLGRDEGSPSKMVQLHVRRKSRAEATIVYPHASWNGASSPLVRTAVFKEQYHSTVSLQEQNKQDLGNCY